MVGGPDRELDEAACTCFLENLATPDHPLSSHLAGPALRYWTDWECPPIQDEEEGLLDVSLRWRETGDAFNPLTTEHEGRVLLLQLNDWPDEPHLWTLLSDGKPVLYVDDWPPRWRRP